MKVITISILALGLVGAAFAADPPSPQASVQAAASAPVAAGPKSDTVILPRETVINLMKVVEAIITIHNDLATQSVITAYQAMVACVNDNPGTDGTIRRMGNDQCPDVTRALQDQPKADKAHAKSGKKH